MGRKRVNADPRFQPKKCRKRCLDDHLTRLPDDVLAIILSSLSLKEAIRTSILSHPWRNLWKRTSRLDFDATRALDRVGESLLLEGDAFENTYKIERLNYASWADTVLEARLFHFSVF
ncbi:F-box family protein [Striga asiatica]|uniref:F-box family protein n=1 Tax=Striga asiatica TaxID=4170 RepID=A0A5A7QE74_STRAF|nr:F-box family protein [Striga asiatica]